MADLSILEYGVYAFFAYGSALMLMISLVKEAPAKPEWASARAMYAFPGVLCFFILAGMNPVVTGYVISTNSTTLAANSSELFSSNSTEIGRFVIQSQVWTIFHYMMGLVMIVYVVFQILILLGLQPGMKR